MTDRPTLVEEALDSIEQAYSEDTRVLVESVLGSESAKTESNDPIRERDVTEAIQIATRAMGEVPSATEYDNWTSGTKWPSRGSVYKLFDSWPDAVAAAGFERPAPQNLEYDRRELIHSLREAADAVGEPLSSSEYEQWATGKQDRPSRGSVSRRFGSWSRARKVAGLDSL